MHGQASTVVPCQGAAPLVWGQQAQLGPPQPCLPTPISPSILLQIGRGLDPRDPHATPCMWRAQGLQSRSSGARNATSRTLPLLGPYPQSPSPTASSMTKLERGEAFHGVAGKYMPMCAQHVAMAVGARAAPCHVMGVAPGLVVLANPASLGGWVMGAPSLPPQIHGGQ